MTDQTIPDVTDDERMLAREWAEDIVTGLSNPRMRAAARVILDAVPAPPRPTLADMTPDERRECKWMQADVDYARAVILLPNASGGRAILTDRGGSVIYEDHTDVTPRPDLPRMEWPAAEKAEDATPTKVGTVIESADDPRLAALPVGTVLLDRDGEATVKRNEVWNGPGYTPIPEEGDEFGPWTVERIDQGADQ